mgnify:CR=1 FL=1
MEKILDIGGKYKYEMGGVILVIILYLISQKYFKDSKWYYQAIFIQNLIEIQYTI